MIRFFSQDISFILKRKRSISQWLATIAETAGHTIGDLNYIFCSDRYLLDINKQFLGHDYYTDVITFDNSDDFFIENRKNGVSGDIYISVDTVRNNAITYGEGFEKEILRVIVHGLLHLIGYDDTDQELQSEMTAAENRALDLYASMTCLK